MSSRWRVAWTLVSASLHVLVALAIVGGLFPFCSTARQRWFVRWWSGRVLTIFRLDLRVVEASAASADRREVADRALRPEGIGAMLVMNHVSWLDIFVVHSLRAARFVAKAEISRWPLLGFLTDRTGAVFVERGKRHAVRDVNRRLAELLGAGHLVGMFPEGSVSDGAHLLPFHGNLIQPAIDAGTPIVVAGLRYRDLHERTATSTYYVGDVTLFESMLRIARHGPLVVELHVLDVLDGTTMKRQEVARAARALIGEAFGFDDERVEAVEGLATVIALPEEPLSRAAAPAGTAPGTALDPRDELL